MNSKQPLFFQFRKNKRKKAIQVLYKKRSPKLNLK